MIVNQNQLIKYAVEENKFNNSKRYNGSVSEFCKDLFNHEYKEPNTKFSYKINIPGFEKFSEYNEYLDLSKQILPLNLQINSVGKVSNKGFMNFENVMFLQRSVVGQYLRSLYSHVQNNEKLEISQKNILLSNITNYFHANYKDTLEKHVLIVNTKNIDDNHALGVKAAALNYIINSALFNNQDLDMAKYELSGQAADYRQNSSFNNFPHIETIVYSEDEEKAYSAIINKSGHVYLQDNDSLSKKCLCMYSEQTFRDDLLNLENLSKNYSMIIHKSDVDINNDVKQLLAKYENIDNNKLLQIGTEETLSVAFIRLSQEKQDLFKQRLQVTSSEEYLEAKINLENTQTKLDELGGEIIHSMNSDKSKPASEILNVSYEKKVSRNIESLFEQIKEKSSFINPESAGEAIVRKPKTVLKMNNSIKF